MPDFTASPLVDALEENLFSLLEKLAAEVNTEALPLIDLSSGSPDQLTPPEVIDSLQSAIHRRENHGYPSFWGKPQVREAIARFYRRQYDVELDPHSEVAVFQGSHIGIGGIPRALLSPGQYLISTDPCYPIYRSAALQSQAAFYGLPLRAENHFLPDFNDLPGKSLTRPGWWCLTIRIIQPAPSATPALFASALQFARRHQVPILHDFAYAAIGSAASDAPLSLFSQPRRQSMGSGNLYFFQDL
ncbi:Aspartate aminotransferase [Klebsiella pneumoniae]|uniref:Aspartate aminotransferase n=1 Tax=Klebsiella pneumoniae TaxID=573 RepID=A0A447RIV4_KLEPN|nr:Aspartate aminotransferase [Klebsiella pneumoniae]